MFFFSFSSSFSSRYSGALYGFLKYFSTVRTGSLCCAPMLNCFAITVSSVCALLPSSMHMCFWWGSFGGCVCVCRRRCRGCMQLLHLLHAASLVVLHRFVGERELSVSCMYWVYMQHCRCKWARGIENDRDFRFDSCTFFIIQFPRAIPSDG